MATETQVTMAMPVVTATQAARIMVVATPVKTTAAATPVKIMVPARVREVPPVKKEQALNQQVQARVKVTLVPETVPELARPLNQARKVKAAPLTKALEKAPAVKVTQAIPAKKKAIAREKAKASLTTQETLIIMAKTAKPAVHLKQ